MNIDCFIDSDDIREHLKKNGYNFSAAEAAFYVWQSGRATLSEKLTAWQEIIDNLPDCSVKTYQDFIKSFHTALKRYIALLKKQFDRFQMDENYYTYEYDTECGGTAAGNFDTVEVCLSRLRRSLNYDKDVFNIHICRWAKEGVRKEDKVPCEELDELSEIFGLHLGIPLATLTANCDLEVLSVCETHLSQDDFLIASLFEDMRGDFTVTFE